ncbi:MAG TPA: hypothetical protein DCE23_05365 [Firmicutes bacterium]|nr:hypothetical protein [Bacillota bacterium]
MKNALKNIIDKISVGIKNQATINYDLSDSYVLIYDEAYGVAKKRKKLLKKPTTKTHTYLGITLFRLILILCLNLFCYLYLKICGYSYIVCTLCIFTPFLYFILTMNIIIFIIRVTCRSKKLKGSFVLNKQGLTDSTFKGIKILFEWSKIKMVIVKKYSIIILTDTPIYFFVNKDVEDELITALKKYKKDLIIVRND